MINTNLSNIKDCGQIWDIMPKCNEGRLCSKCDQTIFDFRGMTDWEIALKHSKSKIKVCGIYDSNAKSKKNNKTRSKYLKSKLNAIAFIGSLTTTTVSNGQNIDPPSDSNLIEIPIYDNGKDLAAKKIINKSSPAIDSSKLVTGVLKDNNKECIVGASIIIEGTTRGTVSDYQGKYVLHVTNEFIQKDSITVIFQYIGYAREEKVITKSDFDDKNELELNLVFEESVHLDVFRVSRLPWYKRLWNKIF